MGDENSIRTLGDYFKPSHEGYRNTIELPVWNNWRLFDPTPSSWIYLHMGGSYCSFSYMILSTGKDRKTSMFKRTKSLLHVRSAVVPTTLNIAWKILSKLLLITRPRVATNYQTKLEKALSDFDSRQERRLSSLETQIEQQQYDMISKINNLRKAVSKKLDDTHTPSTAGNSIAHINLTSTDHIEKEELQRKAKEEVTEESEEELEEETEEETKEEEEDDPKYFTLFPL
nr:hypothetical protein [Tanacetum cinerariifolium]